MRDTVVGEVERRLVVWRRAGGYAVMVEALSIGEGCGG